MGKRMPTGSDAKSGNCGVPASESPSASSRDAAFISPEYKAVHLVKHRLRPGHQGRSGFKFVADIEVYLGSHDVNTVLDYGAGQCSLEKAVKEAGYRVQWTNYDPAHPAIEELPEGQFDLVVATDVLEHVERDRLEAVLDRIRGHARKYVFLQISCVEAAAVLPDGRNAHILVRDREWWIEKLKDHFPGFAMEIPHTRFYHLFVHLTKT